MKLTVYSLCFFAFITSCSNNAEKQAEKTQDSIETKEIEQVDVMLKNEDSIIKAKEKELLEKYGN